MAKKIKLSPKEYYEQYKEIHGLSYPAITKRIREGRSLPEVVKVEEYGRFYVLQVLKK